MEPSLTSGLPLEVFDCVRDIDALAFKAGRHQALVEYSTGRTHKRTALAVFLVAGLFSNQHDSLFRVAAARHGLRGVPPQLAPSAGIQLLSKGLHEGRT